MTILRDKEPDDSYSDKLLKILPAELTALYFLVRSLAGNTIETTPWLLVISLCIAIIFYFISPKMINMKSQKNRILYSFTFVIWVISIDHIRYIDHILTLQPSSETVAIFLTSAIAAVWSFTLPYVMD